jgi:site-specific DNA-methyltransferase (cytosine-N4-specific)
MTAWSEVLAPGEAAVLIVGHNRTTAGGEQIDIATPDLLGEVAISRGFEVRELIRLETWPRYGLHSANGVPGEDALIIARLL